MRLFLDTNILIDYFGNRGEPGRLALRLALLHVFEDAELWVSSTSFTDAFYVLNKHLPSEKLQQGFLNSLKTFQVCSLERADIVRACERGWPDFEDALIDVSAQKVKADYLVTRDAGFSQAQTAVLTPEEVFEMLQQRGLTYAELELA